MKYTQPMLSRVLVKCQRQKVEDQLQNRLLKVSTLRTHTRCKMECVEMWMVTRTLFMEFVVGDVYQAIVFGMFSENKVDAR